MIEFSVANTDLDLRLRLDVAHPVGARALGNKVEVPAMLGEPDLDLTRLTGDAASGGQVEVNGTRLTTSRSVRNHAPRFERRTPARAQKVVERVLARTRCSSPHPMVAKISFRVPMHVLASGLRPAFVFKA